MNVMDQLKKLQTAAQSYQAKRTIAQLRYAYRLSEVKNGAHDALVSRLAGQLLAGLRDQGAITDQAAIACEHELEVLSAEAKAYTLACVAHAHIDMNWMWGFNETVAITLDTFRSVLRLMDEYPAITFSQSQASTYRIVETYDPELFEKIRQKVREGRWEVTASTWVEADKNMTGAESQIRHILYTKQYFRETFGLPDDQLLLDYEPDTFGHNAAVPEILAKGNVKYYFHCRGADRDHIYNWRGPSGATLLVHREPDWYNTQIDYDYADFAPLFCAKNGIDQVLRVYGVGDHGGGPTRRDIERLLDMQTWPCYASIKFSTYHDYFRYLDSRRSSFPTVEGELNYIFTGCYSSESRIKMANRLAEDSLYSAECLSALDVTFAAGTPYTDHYRSAWHKALFNQFHDILPGSGIRETREHALGELAKVLAATYAGRSRALTHLASAIDTSAIETDCDRESFTDGAGMGYKGVAQTNSSLVRGLETQTSDSGCGKTRILHLFNPTAYDRREVYEFPLWDWPGDPGRLTIQDDHDQAVPFEFGPDGGHFWAHESLQIRARVEVPAFGYITLVLSESDSTSLPFNKFPDQPLVEHYKDYQLENERVRVRFDRDMQLVSFYDKETNTEQIDEASGYFSLVWQNHRMTTLMPGNAWVEGYPLKEENLNLLCPVYVTEINQQGGIQDRITFDLSYRRSKLTVSLSLDAGSPVLQYRVDADWHEAFSAEEGIPALKFNLPFAFAADAYDYKIACGIIQRPACAHDVPALGLGAAFNPAADRSLIVLADSVYAYRGEDNALKLTLLRASQDPDRHPEDGRHEYRIGVGLCQKNQYHQMDHTFRYPLQHITNTSHPGSLPLRRSFLELSRNLVLSGMKRSEDGQDLVLHVYEADGRAGQVWFKLSGLGRVRCSDLLEKESDQPLDLNDDRVTVEAAPNELLSFRCRLTE